MASPLIGQGFDLVGTRTRPGQTQAEFFNTQSGQTFENTLYLSNFVNSQYGQNTTADTVFNTLAGGVTPRASALDQIKGDLNSYQQQLYGQPETANLRKSSSITDSITTENGNYDGLTSEYNELRKKLQAIQAPNYQQSYNDLRTSSGIAGVENDFAANQKNLRELPYVNRMNSGNAGVMTEGQLSADTQQKGIPLEIQQGNLLDRLKLAQDFINNSLKFKELDQNASRQSLSDAIGMVTDSINLSRQHVTDLLNQQYRIEDKADAFAKANSINQRFYKLPGSDLVFDTKTQEALPYEEYVRRGGVGVPGAAFPDVQEVIPQTMQEERELVKDLATKYIDAGITINDSLAAAQAKIQNSKIYQDQVRPPKTSSGGSSSSSSSSSGTKYTTSSATSEIMAEWQTGYLQGNGTISSSDYKKGKEWWLSHNLSAASFDKQFGYLIDKSGKAWKSDYGYGSE